MTSAFQRKAFVTVWILMLSIMIMTAIGARSPYTICSAIPWVYWDIHKTGDSKSFPHYFSNTYLAHVPPRALRRRQRRHQYSSGIYVCNITIVVKFFMGNKFRSTRTCEYMITLFILALSGPGTPTGSVTGWVTNESPKPSPFQAKKLSKLGQLFRRQFCKWDVQDWGKPDLFEGLWSGAWGFVEQVKVSATYKFSSRWRKGSRWEDMQLFGHGVKEGEKGSEPRSNRHLVQLHWGWGSPKRHRFHWLTPSTKQLRSTPESEFVYYSFLVV